MRRMFDPIDPFRPRQASWVVGFMVIVLFAISTLFKYFLPVSLPWYIMQCSYIAVIGIAFCWIFFTGELSNCGISIAVMLIMMLPYLVALAESFGLWGVTHADMTTIRQGVVSMSYVLLMMMVGCAAAMIFGSKSADYVCIGLICGNFIIVAGVLLHFGVGDAISQLLSFFLSGGADDNSVSLALEIHDLTFAMGEIMIYLLMYRKGKKKWIMLFFATAAFILGWKRSAIPGLMLGCVYIWLMRKLKKETVLKITLAIGIIMIVLSFAYIIFVYTGLLEWFTNTYDIDMMGRNQMYDWVKSRYWVGPNFLGYGHSYITVIMKIAYAEGTQALNDELTIHSDVLARYIELGFWGSLVWHILQDIVIFRWLAKRYSLEAGLIYFANYMFCFMTYFTDNTMFYYFINIVLHLLPLCVILEEREKEIDRTFGKVAIPC